MSIFEIGMLICFGVGWPLSILKLLRTKNSRGKSKSFLIIVILGYASGVMHKLVYNFDFVIALYLINLFMVLTDLLLTIRYGKETETHHAQG